MFRSDLINGLFLIRDSIVIYQNTHDKDSTELDKIIDDVQNVILDIAKGAVKE